MKVLILTPTLNVRSEHLKWEYDRIVSELRESGVCVITDMFKYRVEDIDVLNSDERRNMYPWVIMEDKK